MGDASSAPSTIKVAVTQVEPVWLDLTATVEKTCNLITEAASKGAQIIAFPECWIPGYPIWIWTRLVDFDMASKYIQNSLKVDSPEMEKIKLCAKENAIAVILGYSENFHDSVYIGQAIISPKGEIEVHRRKMKPTHMERTIFGDASGASLTNVVTIPTKGPEGRETAGVRVSALSCWEHAQPLLKYHTHLQRAAIHIAAWPPLYSLQGKEDPGLWSMTREGCRTLSQTYAIESQAFVLHSTTLLTSAGIEACKTAGPMMSTPGGGSSAVFGPDGRKLSDDLGDTEEGIIYADLNMSEVLKAKGFLDTCGHYSRPDLLWLGVDGREKRHLREDRGVEVEK